MKYSRTCKALHDCLYVPGNSLEHLSFTWEVSFDLVFDNAGLSLATLLKLFTLNLHFTVLQCLITIGASLSCDELVVLIMEVELACALLFFVIDAGEGVLLDSSLLLLWSCGRSSSKWQHCCSSVVFRDRGSA